MGSTYTRQSTFTDGDTITADLFNTEFDQLVAAFAATSGHSHDGTAGEGGPIGGLITPGITLGDNTIDVTLTFDGGSNDGVLKWMEDEDYFEFSDDILIASTEKLQFRDTAIYINSSADGQLDIVADTEIQIAATTIDINGAVALNGAITGATNITLSGELDAATLDISGNADIDGNLDVGGNLTVTGTTTFNGGTLTLGDSAADNVVFGADVNSSIIPNTDNTYDLGSASQEWRDLYLDGTAHIDTLDVDANATVAGTLGVTGIATFTDDIIIGDGKTIGSVSDVDAITIASNGQVTFTQKLIGTELDISGDIDVLGTANLDIVDIDGAVNMATTALVTGVLTTTSTQVATGGITSGSNIVSDTDSTDDLGTTSVRWANLFVDGITATDQITATGFTGTLDGILGSGTAAAATVTTLDTSGAVNLNLTTDSTSSTSGALIVDGGVGIAKKLFVGTDLDVDGTTNLDAVNIDGAVTVGADDQGYDVILYGDTASANMTWDTSADDLIFNGVAGLIVPEGQLTLGSDAVTATADELNILDGKAFLDEDNFASNSATGIASQQSIKAYVDASAGSNIVATGALNSGSITSGFGSIDNGSSDITTTGLISGGSLDIDNVLINGTTIGHTNDTDLITLAADLVTVAGEVSMTTLDIGGTNVTADAGELNTLTGITAVVGELNALDLGTTAIGTAIASKAVVLDSNKDYTGIRNFTITGNLSVGGTTTVVNTVTMNAQNAVLFEGTTADDHETTLSIVDPTADRTINLPDQSGTIPVLAAVSTTAISATPEELNILDGNTSPTSTTVVDADRVVMNDDGTMVQVAVTDLAAYFDDEITAMPNLITTAATTVGALDSGSITSGFGTIDTGASAITTTGLITGGSLTVDDVGVDGKVITMTGSSNDTAVFTVGTNGTLSIVTTDDAAAAANIQITADGTAELAGTTVTLDSGGDIDLAATDDINIPSGVGLTFGDDGEKIEGNGTDLTITSGAKINLTATSDVHIPNNVGIVFGGDSEKIEGDGTDLTIAGNNINLTAAVDVIIDADNEIELNSTLIDVNGNLDVSGTIVGASTLSATTGTFSGILKTDDATEATSTTDGSLQTDGGLSVVKDAVFGDDIKLLSDASVIHFGADSEVTLTHVHDAGLALKHTATADDKPIVLTLQTGETDIAADDELGVINFQAPNEGAGTDAILVAAGIAAVSEGDFSASNNATKLSFRTGASEAASEKMSLSSAGLLTIADDFIIKDGGTIGSASDVDAITIASNGQVTLTQTLIGTDLDISGDVDVDGTLEADAITIGGTAVGSIFSPIAGGTGIVTTGALDAGSITSGFGNIDTGSSTITTTGLISGGSLDIDNVLINGTTIGHTDDTDLITLANGVVTVAGEVSMTTLDIGGTNVTADAGELNQLAGAVAKTAGKETIWVPASAMQPTTSNGCSALTTVETTSGRPDLVVLDFDKDSDEFAQFSVAFPKSWNAGTVTFQVFWAGIAATTDVDWMVDAVAISNNTTIDVAYGTAVVVTDNAQGAVEELNVSAESGALTIAGSPGDDELCFFRIGRDVSGDAMAGDARLAGIKVFFTTDLANDA